MLVVFDYRLFYLQVNWRSTELVDLLLRSGVWKAGNDVEPVSVLKFARLALQSRRVVAKFLVYEPL
jgi:hypothetical protein